MLKFKKEWHRDAFFAMALLTLGHLAFVVWVIQVVYLTEIHNSLFKILPKSLKRKYLQNSIQDVEDRLSYAKQSAIYYEKRLEDLKWDLERLG